MIVQPGLCRTWSEIRKTVFLTTRLICFTDTIDKRQHPSVGDQQTERNTLKNPRIPTGDSDMIQEESATKSRAKKACCVGCRCGLCREHCINCHKLFPVLRSKSKKRFHVTRPLAAPSGMSIKTFFESVLGYQVAVPLDVKLDQFVCDECYSIFSRFQRAREKFETVLSELKKMTSIDSVLYPGLEIGLKKLEDGSSKLLPVFNDSCDDNFQKQTASHISVTGNENDDQSENSGLAQTNENVSQIKYSSRNGGTQPIFQLKNRSIQRLLKQYGRMPTAKVRILVYFRGLTKWRIFG